jgi:uncharacterized membrane protein YkvA (DUF1232 family)
MEQEKSETFLQTLLINRSAVAMDDSALVRHASSRLTRCDEKFPFYTDLLHNTLHAMHVLLRVEHEHTLQTEARIMKRLAKGALILFTEERSLAADVRLYEDTKNLSFAARRFSTLWPDMVPGKPPQLTRHERADVETRVMEMGVRNLKNPELVVDFSKEHLTRLGKLPPLEFIRELTEGATRLIALLAGFLHSDNPNRNDYLFRMCLGALTYFNATDDMYPDSLGVIGFLDDHYAVQFTLALLSKHMPTRL